MAVGEVPHQFPVYVSDAEPKLLNHGGTHGDVKFKVNITRSCGPNHDGPGPRHSKEVAVDPIGAEH